MIENVNAPDPRLAQTLSQNQFTSAVSASSPNNRKKYLLGSLLAIAFLLMIIIVVFGQPIISALKGNNKQKSLKPAEVTSSNAVAHRVVSDSQQPPGISRYENKLWGIAFDYPEQWKIKESTAGGYIFFDVDDSNTPDIAVDLLRGSYESIEQGIIDHIYFNCDADGPTESISCPADKTRIEQFSNSGGVDGYLVHRTRVVRTYSVPTQSFLYEDQPELVVVYPLKIGDNFAIMFSAWEATRSAQVSQVAETFRRI